MPKRNDIETILIIGAGPIVIGQACEFDYSGVQACRALREEGYRVVLINSNPATIMTDPATADATYIEPIEWRVIERIIEREKVDAVLPTMGGQTALNCAVDLEREGVLTRHGVKLIGASLESIEKAENRERFDEAMRAIGLETPRSMMAHNLEEAMRAPQEMGFPLIVRASFTLGGGGSGVARDAAEFERICRDALALSPGGALLIDESLLGWKEFEMEVMRDSRDNCIIVCSIENFDPMGVHTGDSITVAPAQTLTDREYQRMRDASLAVLREIGVESGGSNVQFAVDPESGRQVVIEMNPRVSRSSALASKATGFPIARVAAKLAVGLGLDELLNEITGGATPASFEPSIDYVVTKVPRFAFEKFGEADRQLTTQMKSVGEVMAIGRNFPESLQKALRGLETGSVGLEPKLRDAAELDDALSGSGPERLWYIADAFRFGMSVEEVHRRSGVDAWFLSWIEDLIAEEATLDGLALADLERERLLELKRKGFSDARLATLLGVDEARLREHRRALGIKPSFKRVDTCAAEFPTDTAYMYSSYDLQCEARPSDRDKVIVLGSGPNRIGQGIEFDYCCVHAALACREEGLESIMVNCNPETVSTDYDTSDRLYFEPITIEDVLAIVEVEQPRGVIVQFGGQTPLKLTRALESEHGVKILGTGGDAIDRAEDRERFQKLLRDLDLRQPPNGLADDIDSALAVAAEVGYPLVVRPSYVLGGRAMEIVRDDAELRAYMESVFAASTDSAPVLLDRFLERAIEVDVDAVSDGRRVVIGGIMEHIEQAGVHSGDSACVLPPHTLQAPMLEQIRQAMRKLASELGVVGLVNAQLAVQDDMLYVLEVNPRASRSAPFVSKAIGVPLADVATRCMLGRSLEEQGYVRELLPPCFCVKEVVFPFDKFAGVDPILGPEMKSTGEVMGFGDSFAEAFGRAELAAGMRLPAPDDARTALISVRDADKPRTLALVQRMRGFKLLATAGTADFLREAGCQVERVNKVKEGSPHVVDLIASGDVHFVINTTEGRQSIRDSATMRRAALAYRVPYVTTLPAAELCWQAMAEGFDAADEVRCLQRIHRDVRPAEETG